MKVSLIDLARKIENDLIIIENAPGRFKLSFKDEVLPTTETIDHVSELMLEDLKVQTIPIV